MNLFGHSEVMKLKLILDEVLGYLYKFREIIRIVDNESYLFINLSLCIHKVKLMRDYYMVIEEERREKENPSTPFPLVKNNDQ